MLLGKDEERRTIPSTTCNGRMLPTFVDHKAECRCDSGGSIIVLSVPYQNAASRISRTPAVRLFLFLWITKAKDGNGCGKRSCGATDTYARFQSDTVGWLKRTRSTTSSRLRDTRSTNGASGTSSRFRSRCITGCTCATRTSSRRRDGLYSRELRGISE